MSSGSSIKINCTCWQQGGSRVEILPTCSKSGSVPSPCSDYSHAVSHLLSQKLWYKQTFGIISFLTPDDIFIIQIGIQMTAFIDIPVGFGVRGSSQGHVHVYGKRENVTFVFEIKIREILVKWVKIPLSKLWKTNVSDCLMIGHNVEWFYSVK